MEIRSPHTLQRRRHNRSGGRNRNRQRNRGGNRGGGGNRNRNSGGSGNRNRNRNRNGARRRQPKPTSWEKFLFKVTFGALGRPPGKQQKKKKNESASEAPNPAQDKPAKPAAEKRKRAKSAVTSPRLYVGNLDYSTTEGELEELFRGVGNVQSAEVVTNGRTQQSKGFAFVEMVSVDEAKRAVDVLDDEDFMGRRLIVSGARSSGPRDSDFDDDDSGDEHEPAMAESGSSRDEN